jgi:hypothetical protein
MSQTPNPDNDRPWGKIWHVGVSNTYYLEAIGQIVILWSHIESQTKWLFWRYSGIDERMARLITAASRYGDVVDLTKRVVDKTQDNQVLVDSLNWLFGECARLKTIRDHIAHWEWGSAADSAGVTNMTAARDLSALDSHDFQLADLRALAEEMNNLLPHFHGHLLGASVRKTFPEGDWSMSSPAPWLDRFEPRREAPQRKSNAQKRQPPPRS